MIDRIILSILLVVGVSSIFDTINHHETQAQIEQLSNQCLVSQNSFAEGWDQGGKEQ